MNVRHMAILSLLLTAPTQGQAQWQRDGAPLSAAAGMQHFSKSVPDGAGGMIVTWMDVRGSVFDIYAQRINSSGVVQWPVNGVAVCAAAGTQFAPIIVSDGAGGAIIAWIDSRNDAGDIYAQRVNASGTSMWTVNGVPLCTATGTQGSAVVVADGSGGAIVSWIDERLPTSLGDVYAQRVNPAGAVQWTANGVGVCVLTSYQASPAIASDGSGGAIVAWTDYRNSDYDIFARRINSAGVPQWPGNGIAICTESGQQGGAMVVASASGSAFILWTDYRFGGVDVLMQKVDASGSTLLGLNGVYVSAANDAQYLNSAISDGAGGMYVAWSDYRNLSDVDVYAQRVNAAGESQWMFYGVPVAALAYNQTSPALVYDGANGLIAAWVDNRSSVPHIYTQRLKSSGEPMWALNGVALSINPAQSRDYCSVVSDGAGGAIVSWDVNYGGFPDVYAQRVEGDFGAWGTPEPKLVTVEDVPNDQGGKVAVNWTRSHHDALPSSDITHYSVWRAVDANIPANTFGTAGTSTESWSVAPDFSGPALVHERIGTTDYYWEWVANQNASHDPSYSFAASTREDSVASSTSTHYFRVLAHTSDPSVLFKSAVVSGHSVDNLAPPAPLVLVAQRVGTDVQLHWNRAVAPDLRDYAVYRATSSGVTPVPINFLASAEDTVATDANAPSSALYYIVTAYDVHANQSHPSNEAHVGSLTGIGNLPSVTALTVLQNHPNPFTATTEFQIGLPESGDVRVDVFDVAGRRVMTMDAKGVKGWQRIPFAARDQRGRSLASGVYFARVSAAGKTITKKMVIAR